MATALLVIDAQVGMFTPPYAVYQADEVLNTIKILIKRARQMDIPVVYVQHNGATGSLEEPGTPTWEIHGEIAPKSGDVVVQKHKPDAFFETILQDELAARGIKRLVIVGMQSDMCVDATCREAKTRDYDVVLVEDAHSTDTPDAEKVIAHHNDILTALVTVSPARAIELV